MKSIVDEIKKVRERSSNTANNSNEIFRAQMKMYQDLKDKGVIKKSGYNLALPGAVNCAPDSDSAPYSP